MRPYECSLTREGKAAFVELLLQTGQAVRIRRCCGREEWRIGGWIRYDWCFFYKEADSDVWNATFGGNFRTPEILKPLFSDVITSRTGCSWIWPERKR